MTSSLRNRLLLGVAAGSAIVLVASGLVLYSLVRSALVAEFDVNLATEVRTLAALVEQDGRYIETEMAEKRFERFERAERPEYYQLWFDDGRVIERSTRLGSADLELIAGTLDQPEFRFAILPDGRPGRTVGVEFPPQLDDEEEYYERRKGQSQSSGSRKPVTLVLARDTLQLERTLGSVKLLIAGVFAVALVLSLLVAAPIVRLGLNPLAATSSEIQRLDSKTLGSRLDPTNAPTEVRSVIDCLNGLLEHLEEAFQRERSFSANVAHELRTPLAGLRSSIEVALSKPRGPEEYERVLVDCSEICVQTQVIVENLLALARLDAGQCEVRREEVKLGELLPEAWTAYAERARSMGFTVHWDVVDGKSILTDRQKLRLILTNLFDNAVTYTGAEGEIAIEARTEEGQEYITVRNTGTQLPTGSVKHVFERFWRGDASRGETGRHAGLGLSLCKTLAGVLGYSIAASANGGEFSVSLRFADHGVDSHEPAIDRRNS